MKERKKEREGGEKKVLLLRHLKSSGFCLHVRACPSSIVRGALAEVTLMEIKVLFRVSQKKVGEAIACRIWGIIFSCGCGVWPNCWQDCPVSATVIEWRGEKPAEQDNRETLQYLSGAPRDRVHLQASLCTQRQTRNGGRCQDQYKLLLLLLLDGICVAIRSFRFVKSCGSCFLSPPT